MPPKTFCHPKNLNHHINEDVRPWIDLIDGLRSVGIEKDLSIPCIVAMGDQSSGKSSVLEQLSGVQFPRGTGLVTRCPTELRMKNTPQAEWKGSISLIWDKEQPTEAGELTAPEEIGDKIISLTELITDGHEDIQSQHSILLEISSPDHPDLTIIDLPGIVRTRMPGQSETVVQDVDRLIQRYLEEKRTVILAVVPISLDIATIDIIERAAMVDPDGNRTVGVLTKPDMIGPGEERSKMDILNNLTKPLKLGYTAVLNRNQTQIDEGMSLLEAKAYEKYWFENHQYFGSMTPSLFGSDNLAQKLSSILLDHIKETVPELNHEIVTLLKSTEHELKCLGAPPPTGRADMKTTLMAILRNVARDVKHAVNGPFDSEIFHKVKDIRVHAKFNRFAADFEKQIVVELRPTWEIEKLKELNSQMRGRELPGFLTASVFDHLVREFVQEWEKPLHELLDDTSKATLSACMSIVDYHVPRFKTIAASIKATIQEIMTQRSAHAKSSEDSLTGLSYLLSNESIPSTLSNRFIQLCDRRRMESFKEFLTQCLRDQDNEDGLVLASSVLSVVIDKYQERYSIGSDLNDSREAEDLASFLESYWSIASERFIDTGKRSVDRLLWQEIDVNIENEFTKKIDVAERLDDFFYENYEEQQKRIRLESKLERLQTAKRNLDRVINS